jgi:hypothetical protein
MVKGLHEGDRDGEVEDKVVRGGASDGPVLVPATIGPRRSKTRVTVLGIPTPLGVITETAVYILRKRDAPSPSRTSSSSI